MACITVPTAMLISAGLGTAGSLVSGFMGAGAAKDAAATQSASYREAAAKLQPFVDSGMMGLEKAKNLLGLGPGGSAAIQAELEATPGYKFTRDEGLKATQSSYAGKGLAISGPALKGAGEWATNLASTTYQEMLKNYLELAGIGVNAATGTGSLIVGAGASQAAGTVGATNALTSGISGAVGSLDSAALMLALNNAGMFGSNANALTKFGSPNGANGPGANAGWRG